MASDEKEEGTDIGKLFQSSLTKLSDRLTNPFIFSFVISWLLLNYKVVVVILSTGPYIDKFKY